LWSEQLLFHKNRPLYLNGYSISRILLFFHMGDEDFTATTKGEIRPKTHKHTGENYESLCCCYIIICVTTL
ncbi:unnamed protein product, partial [Tenebrio molitor]